jgi:hypothetical protein
MGGPALEQAPDPSNLGASGLPYHANTALGLRLAPPPHKLSGHTFWDWPKLPPARGSEQIPQREGHRRDPLRLRAARSSGDRTHPSGFKNI